MVPTGKNGNTIAAGPTDVVILRGLTINGSGVGSTGILFTSGAQLHVENSSISGFASDGIYFNPSTASKFFANNVSVRNVGNVAVHIVPSGSSAPASAYLNNVKMAGYSRGLRAADWSTVTVRNSVASDGTINGIVANGTTMVDITIENSVVSGNVGYGLVANGPNTTIRMSNVTVSKNGTGIGGLTGGAVLSFGNNRVNGNQANGMPTMTVSPGQI